jgi:hypothetical protein
MLTMTTHTLVKTLTVSNRFGADFGSVEIEEVADGLILGDFTPGPDYSTVQPIFRHFSDVVEQQSFSYLDAVQESIEAIGIVIRFEGEDTDVPVHDVQIYTDGAFSCRLPVAGMNGKHAG